MGRCLEKKVEVNGKITLHEGCSYHCYLQSACVDLQKPFQAAKRYITWDPTQPIATRPQALQQNSVWYTYKTADGCKAGWTCVVRHAPVGRGAEGLLRVNWDLTKNICELYTTAGGIGTAYTYTPYGAVSTTSNTAKLTQPIQWSSEMHDAELGLAYYNYRYYNLTDGRWMRRYPIGIYDTNNLYSYVRNSVLQK